VVVVVVVVVLCTCGSGLVNSEWWVLA